MNTTKMAVEKNSIIRQLLDVNDAEVLEQVKQLLRRENKKHPADWVSEPEEEYKPLNKQEVLSGLNEAFAEARLAREGKLQGRPLKDVLNEL
ncbi:MAG: hypothetical protein Q4G48_05390 [Bacteroidia bacterium]|nr:hypothetical protein [Bacteroidia bacterium]